MTKNNPWASLTSAVNSKRCSADHMFDFFWALGKNGEYMLAISHSSLEDWSAKNLNLSGIAIEQYQTASGYRLVLKLHDNSDWDLFLNLCNDLIQAAGTCVTQKEMLAVVYNRLQRWQKLFRKVGKKLLSTEEQQGLIGELHFLKKFLLTKYSETEAFEFWRGPYGEQQDFGIGNVSIEVKTKRGTSVPYVQISSADQLDCRTDQCFLFVISLNASPASAEAFSLNQIVSAIKAELQNNDALDLFESLLAEAGYIEMPEYAEPFFVITKESAYEVKDDFPRLTSDSLAMGIHSVQYRIELHACKAYEIALNQFEKRLANEFTN